MLQKFLDGKKKYSALIITLLAAIVPVLVQDPATQKTVMDVIPSVAALIAGVFYLVIQGDVDKVKEQAAGAVAVETAKAANGAAAQPAAQPLLPVQPASQPAPAEPLIPFDVKAFHEDVIATVKATYTEKNLCTIFYKARDKGTVTPCQNLSQAVDYWSYLVDLAVDAKDWLKEETEKKKGECGRSPEYYVFNRDFNTTIKAANCLAELAQSGVDWTSKLAPFQRTLYTIGALSSMMIT